MDYISLLKIFGLIGETVITAYENPVAALASAPAKVGDGAEHAKKFAESLCSEQNKLNRCIQQRIVADCGQMSQDAAKEYRKKIKQILQSIKQIHLGDYLDISKREEVIESLIGSGTFDDETAYEKCRELLEWTLNEIKINLSKLAPEDEVSLRTYSNTEMICQWIKQNANPVQSSCVEEPPKSAITDHNRFYCKDFYKPLFMNDERNATIDKVFVKPRLTVGGDIIAQLNDWLTDQYPIHILYGKPGVGKSTLAAFLAALIGDGDKSFADENDLTLSETLCDRLHILRLRTVKDQLSEHDAWGTLRKCLGGAPDEAYDKKIFILDGMDEVCVLRNDFDGKSFLENLAKNLQEKYVDAKIIVTTREGYFIDPQSNQITSHTMEWTQAEMNLWCDKYASVGEGKADYCKKFRADYTGLGTKDKRREIFCVPIILYLCCHQQIDISQNHTVSDVYHTVFHEIYEKRAYSAAENDRIQYYISWQFTKELAYQMHLHDKLEVAIGSDLVQNAMKRTKTVLREKMPQDEELEKALKDITETDFDQYFQTHFAIMHFQSGDTKHGAEFAHKTVGEYFTAVKLYEDYFECVKDPETTTEQVWKNIFEAFRYKMIPKGILKFLTELTKKGLGDPPEKLFEHYYKGMEEVILWEIMSIPVIAEYPLSLVPFYLISDDDERPEYWMRIIRSHEQVGEVFRMLTHYLTVLGFDNANGDTINIRMSFSSYAMQPAIYVKLRCEHWKHLDGIFSCSKDIDRFFRRYISQIE